MPFWYTPSPRVTGTQRPRRKNHVWNLLVKQMSRADGMKRVRCGFVTSVHRDMEEPEMQRKLEKRYRSIVGSCVSSSSGDAHPT